MNHPSYVQIEPVGQCNLRCQMCSVQFRQDGLPHGSPSLMPLEKFKQLIDQLQGVKILHLQGLGEPLMHPNFFEMVEYAVGSGMQVTTNSNLTLLTERNAERFITSGLECLHVSVDGATPETYERIRVGSSFERVIHNLQRVVEIRRRLGVTHPRLQLVMVVMRQNLHELPDLVQRAHEWGVDGLFVQHLCHEFGESSLPTHYQPMREFVQAETLLADDPERVESYFHQARTVAQAIALPLRLPRTQPQIHPPGTPGSARCDWAWRGMYFSYQGLAMPCCMVSTPDRIHFGNGLDQGVIETWTGSAYQAFRNQLESNEPPEVCRSCSIYSGTF